MGVTSAPFEGFAVPCLYQMFVDRPSSVVAAIRTRQNRVSDNVGGVKHLSSRLRHALPKTHLQAVVKCCREIDLTSSLRLANRPLEAVPGSAGRSATGPAGVLR
jgi:hypothetical protein